MKIGAEQAHFTALIFANVLTWASFFSIIFLTNPKSAGIFGVIVLYVSFISGLISLSFLLWQLKILKKK